MVWIVLGNWLNVESEARKGNTDDTPVLGWAVGWMVLPFF